MSATGTLGEVIPYKNNMFSMKHCLHSQPNTPFLSNYRVKFSWNSASVKLSVQQSQLLSSGSAGRDKNILTRYLNSKLVNMWDPEHTVCLVTAECLRSKSVCEVVNGEMGYESLSMLIWAKILSAGPSLMFMVPMRWSSFSSSRACPSISWERNSSAISRQPAAHHQQSELPPLDHEGKSTVSVTWISFTPVFFFFFLNRETLPVTFGL